MGFDPATLMIVSTIASGAMSTLGAYQQASAQKAQSQYQSKIAANNAIIAENNAKYEEARSADAIQRGEEDAQAIRRRISQLEGQQRSTFSGSGVVIDTGSPLDTLADTRYLGEIDVENRLATAEREAAGYQQSAYNLENQSAMASADSSMYRSAAKNISPLFSAGSQALASASSVSTKWDRFKSGSSGGGSLPWQKAGNVNPQGGYY